MPSLDCDAWNTKARTLCQLWREENREDFLREGMGMGLKGCIQFIPCFNK
jgi:hypothetical protein